MAKKKLSDILRDMFGTKLDEEIEIDVPLDNKASASDNKDKDDKLNNVDDDSKGTTSETKENDVNNEVDTSKTTNEVEIKGVDTEVKEMVDTKLFEDGWFDPATGKIDESKIKSVEALEAIRSMNKAYTAEKEQRMIAEGLASELKNYSLNVSEDTLKKVLDMKDVKIDETGTVVGIKDALEALKTAEPGFFKNKEKESNPLNEGFNPVEKKNTENITSFSQAFRLMDEINS